MKNEIEKIELLEKQLSQKLGVYKNFKKSESNDKYFANLHYKTMDKLAKKNSKTTFMLKPTISYAFLFVISFVVSFQFISFGDELVSNGSGAYLFSETSLWIEEVDYLSNAVDEDFMLDYVSYMNSELNYSNINSINYEINQLSKSELDELYENLKSKKIL